MLKNKKVAKASSNPLRNSLKELEYGLTKYQWYLLKEQVKGHVNNFCGKSLPVHLLFGFIDHRTLHWSKITESFTFDVIRNGSERYRNGGTGLTNRSISHAKKYLIKSGIIQVSKDRPKKLWYRFNLVGMLRFFIKVSYPLRYDNSDHKNLLIILEIIKPHFKNTNNEINFNFKGKPMQLKDISEIVNEQAKASEVKRKEKQDRKKLNASTLQNYFKQSCEDVNVPFSSADWTDRDWGSAKNFLNECEQNNKNARLIIQQVCKHWWHFRSRLTSENGKGVMLDEVVNFRQFFNFRGEIQTWLNVNVKEANVLDEKKPRKNLGIAYPNGTDCLITEEEFEDLKKNKLSYGAVYERRRQAGKLPEGCMETNE